MDLTSETRELKALLGGQVFGAKFTKRDGTVRSGSFRLGVRSHLQGGEKSYDTDARGHLTVFDMTKRAYRTIRVESLIEVNAHGTTWRVSEFNEGQPVTGDDEWGNR